MSDFQRSQPPRNQPSREEVYGLASDVLWGQPSADDIRRLEKLVTTSARARQVYVEFICDSCNLQAYSARSASGVLILPSPSAASVGRQKSSVQGFLQSLLHAGKSRLVLVSAIVLVAGIVIGMIGLRGRQATMPEQPLAPPNFASSEPDGGAAKHGNVVSPEKKVASPTPDVPIVNDASTGVAKSSSPLIPSASAAARLTRAVDCRWADSASAPKSGDALLDGQNLELVSGVAEIVFGDGAHGLLTGPASLEICSSAAAALKQGTFTLDNPTSTDFDLLTPGMKYVLNSAEFALNIGSVGGIQEVHVFRGVVKGKKSMEGFGGPGSALASGERNQPGIEPPHAGPNYTTGVSQPIELSTNEAYRIGAADKPVERFNADQSRFLRASQFAATAATEPADYLRWREASAKLARDRDLIAYYDFQCDKSKPEVLRNCAASGEKLDGHIESPLWVQGRWPIKSSLQFRDRSHCVRVNIPGKFDVITAAAWVNVHALRSPLTSIIGSNSWHQRVGQCHWQIVFNGLVEMAPCFSATPGPPKHAEITTFDKPTLSGGDRDTWCHLAAVYDSRANTVAYYKNGQIVGVAHPETHLIPVEFGASEIGNWEAEPGDKVPNRLFHGRIDELVLVSRAMTDVEIKHLYESGKPDVVK